MDTEDQFDEIIQATISKANGVRCTPEEYRSGLRYMVSELRTAIQASEDTSG